MACRDCAQFEIWKGEGYCNYWRKNTDGGDTCQHDTSGGGGCYITTALCTILGLEDDCPIMTTLRRFRDGVLAQDARYQPILEEYEVLGPRISAALAKDPQGSMVAQSLHRQQLQPIAALIEEGRHEAAIQRYRNMVLELVSRYELA